MVATRRMSLDVSSDRLLSFFLMSHSIFLASRYSRKELNKSTDYIKINIGEADNPT